MLQIEPTHVHSSTQALTITNNNEQIAVVRV